MATKTEQYASAAQRTGRARRKDAQKKRHVHHVSLGKNAVVAAEPTAEGTRPSRKSTRRSSPLHIRPDVPLHNKTQMRARSLKARAAAAKTTS